MKHSDRKKREEEFDFSSKRIFEFPKEVVGEEYAGRYVLRELASGYEVALLRKKHSKRRITVRGPEVDLDEVEWSFDLLCRSLVEAPFTISPENIRKLPPRMYQFLVEHAIRLNTLSDEESSFLLTAFCLSEVVLK